MVLGRDRYLSANIFLRCSFYYLSQVAIGKQLGLVHAYIFFLAFETSFFFAVEFEKIIIFYVEIIMAHK